MDIPNRGELEAKATKALKRLRGEQLARLKAYLGHPPDPSKVPQKFWDEIEEDDNNLFFLLFWPVAVAAFDSLLKQFGGETSDGVEGRLKTRMETRAAEVASQIAENHASRFVELAKRLEEERKKIEHKFDERTSDEGITKEDREQAKQDRDEGLSRVEQEFNEALDSDFADSGDESQAITETTNAWSEGEDTAEETLRKQGADVLTIWVTERDDRVCPICQNLDGHPKEYWDDEYPSGPPAHPRCRCFLKHEGAKLDGGKNA